jgi:hypothetical protein
VSIFDLKKRNALALFHLKVGPIVASGHISMKSTSSYLSIRMFDLHLKHKNRLEHHSLVFYVAAGNYFLSSSKSNSTLGIKKLAPLALNDESASIDYNTLFRRGLYITQKRPKLASRVCVFAM